LITDQGPQFTSDLLKDFCEINNIQQIFGRINHPQTNGKIERWYGTYKQEFKDGEDTLDSFVKYYNERRVHQGINYQTPLERYKCNINVV
jgi:transposase InsO family protein